MVRQYEDVLDEFGPRFVVDLPAGDTPTTISTSARVNLAAEFGRHAPLVVEIGPGSGEQMVSFAQAHPEWNILAVEAWHPGVARCIAHAVKADVWNIRIVEGDAAQVLPIIFGLASAGVDDPREVAALAGIVDGEHPNASNPRADMLWTFFPDPWRKARHRKRRLVAEPFSGIVAGILAEGGLWRLATDWDDYAWQMRDTVESSPFFDNVYAGQRPDSNDPEPERGGFSPRWEERLMTRFEQRGIEAGRTIHDITARRNAVVATPGKLASSLTNEDVQARVSGTPRGNSSSKDN
ncbi:tRNA (guanine-N7)-methyltransferase [Arcanobacterium haemolyticum]|nr:tRNA (guanine-N7)-methyltransferase [Arcanobacterium haemolyticum]